MAARGLFRTGRLLLVLSLLGHTAVAQETSAPSSEARVALQTTYLDRGKWLAERELVTWFGDAKQFWLVTQSSKAQPVGEVLLISHLDPNGGGPLARLRMDLSRMGWRTHYAVTPAAATAGQMLSGITQALPGSERFFVMCEGSACLEMAEGIQRLPATGLVFINLPVLNTQDPTSLAQREQLQLFAGLSRSSLILQEHPNGWPVQLPLAADIELHLLPRSNAALGNSRILRRFRGWLKRRHQIG